MEENNNSELSADEIVQSRFSEFLPMHVNESEEDAKEEMLIQKFVEMAVVVILAHLRINVAIISNNMFTVASRSCVDYFYEV